MTEAIQYIVASQTYRLQNRDSFINLIKDADACNLFENTRKLHLAALAAHRLAELGDAVSPEMLSRFHSYGQYQDAARGIFFKELQFLDRSFRSHAVKAILLKGASSYGKTENGRSYRKINDIDLLPFPETDWDAFSRVLKQAGYIFMENVAPAENYCKGIAVKDIPDSFVPQAAQFSSKLYRDGNFSVYLDLHHSLFLTNNGRNVRPEQYCEKCLDEGGAFFRLVPEAELSYLCIKVFVDIQLYLQGTSRCESVMKLASDIVENLEGMTSGQISDAMKIAKDWDALYEVATVLNFCRPLVPEISFANDVRFPFIGFGELLNKLLRHANHTIS
ncbi:nucleotidyltransferase family protein [Flavobacterium sp. MAH-1]|uniref:Nucleotidyltransferase family protein n=1 Tax=Flavobacterium agri TaxID=2743471 RepID=A0A7Y8Y0S2_9FLAO|nr:nucleotidyltransferase family protein [Flavobacterium agri]NUY80469.1 nucleotidyltransferase family protein [Flavobacterium agri]NYA70494.1 nucleotidyltransferase family protein [Flavobacterium agri]